MDLRLSEDGDLVIENGDLAVTGTRAEELAQLIRCRLMTNAPDWYHHPWLGANFEDVLGEPCTPETASVLERNMVDTLTRDGLLSRSDVVVRVVPGREGLEALLMVSAGELERPLVMYVRPATRSVKVLP